MQTNKPEEKFRQISCTCQLQNDQQLAGLVFFKGAQVTHHIRMFQLLLHHENFFFFEFKIRERQTNKKEKYEEIKNKLINKSNCRPNQGVKCIRHVTFPSKEIENYLIVSIFPHLKLFISLHKICRNDKTCVSYAEQIKRFWFEKFSAAIYTSLLLVFSKLNRISNRFKQKQEWRRNYNNNLKATQKKNQSDLCATPSKNPILPKSKGLIQDTTYAQACVSISRQAKQHHVLWRLTQSGTNTQKYKRHIRIWRR